MPIISKDLKAFFGKSPRRRNVCLTLLQRRTDEESVWFTQYEHNKEVTQRKRIEAVICTFSQKNLVIFQNIHRVLPNSGSSASASTREKDRDVTRSYDKSQYTNRNVIFGANTVSATISANTVSAIIVFNGNKKNKDTKNKNAEYITTLSFHSLTKLTLFN